MAGSAAVVRQSADGPPELRRQYLQNVVHELSTPLTPLLGYLKLFQKGSLGEVSDLQRRCLDRMTHAANRLHRILEDLSYLLQMESVVYRPVTEPVNVGDLVRRAIEETRSNAEEEKS